MPTLSVSINQQSTAITHLSWDSEGGDKTKRNLLQQDTAVTAKFENADARPVRLSVEMYPNGGFDLLAVVPSRGDLATGEGADAARLQIHFPWDPRVTPVTVLPADISPDGAFTFPAIVSAPDWGQMLVRVEGGTATSRLSGDRERHVLEWTVEVAPLADTENVRLRFTPIMLDAPAGVTDKAMWRQARRGWWNAWQLSAKWGAQDRPFSAPAGVLGNNSLSDPASCSLWFYADQAYFTPEIAPGISMMPVLRRTIDWWLDTKVRPSGEVICYWDYGNFLDANAGPLIASWDYVEATGDHQWLQKRIERLEFIADFLAKRDIDGDGLVEATQSGNRGTLVQPARSSSWWDALNTGHKDGYSNAVIYRAWRCLADLEGKLGRKTQQTRYSELADRLKSSYFQTLYNPQTGWLAWWKSADGELHDYASPTLNGLAIEYGLVEPEQGKLILARLRNKMKQAGFTRFDLGVPPMLIPVNRSDYLTPDTGGTPKREDGTDTFGQYMNGGITAGHVLHFLAAHYVVGDAQPADEILRAMLQRQMRGEFQNGVTNAANKGIDWTTWDGKPSGYEGYLADSFRFLQAVALREPELRARLYRPLMPSP